MKLQLFWSDLRTVTLKYYYFFYSSKYDNEFISDFNTNLDLVNNYSDRLSFRFKVQYYRTICIKYDEILCLEWIFIIFLRYSQMYDGILSLILWPYCLKNPDPQSGTYISVYTYYYYVDVSYHICLWSNYLKAYYCKIPFELYVYIFDTSVKGE